MDGSGLTLFFPAWNEEACIGQALDRALDVLPRIVRDYEILVVDDGSTDGTVEIAEGYARKNPRVRVLRHDRNRGLGAALKTGFASSTKDLVVYSDIDLPFDLEEIERAKHLLESRGGDLVCAFRRERASEGLRRVTYSLVWNFIVQTRFRIHVRDVNFGFKLIHRRVLEAISLESEGSFIDAELVVKASRRGFKILQMGVDYFPRTRGVSKLSSPAVIAAILVDMVRLGPSTSAPSSAARPIRAPLRVVPKAKTG